MRTTICVAMLLMLLACSYVHSFTLYRSPMSAAATSQGPRANHGTGENVPSDAGSPRAGVSDLCPPESSRLQCFEDILAQVIRNIDKNSGGKGLKKRDADEWKLCPPNTDRVSCFERYMMIMLKNQARKTKRGRSLGPRITSLADENHPDAQMLSRDVGLPNLSTRKQRPQKYHLSWRLCPDSLSKIECFDNYLNIMLSMVVEKQGGKVDNLENEDLRLQLDSFMKNVAMAEDALDLKEGGTAKRGVATRRVLSSLRHHCSDDMDIYDCFRHIHEIDTESPGVGGWKELIETRPISGDYCDVVPDSYLCYLRLSFAT